jgi:hypoxanthine phosphoribosyltransferase
MEDIHECQCAQAGYCEFFKQEMTYDPPNWQWCQEASKADRDEYKIACDRKRERDSFGNVRSVFITSSKLIEDCIKHFIPKIANLNLSGIVAIPRSGFLPASVCATSLNLPLYTISNTEIVICNSLSDFGGYRMKSFSNSPGKLLFIDDTFFSGYTLAKIKKMFGLEHHYGAVYSTEAGLSHLDVYGEQLDNPHLLEWHFFNSGYATKTLFDLDGVFSPNVPFSELDCDDKYKKYISNVEPFYHRLPKTRKLKAIVTGRLDKFRKETEDWLARYNIKYNELIMFPTERREQRDANHVEEVGKYKADVHKRSNAVFFMESEKAEGRVIRKHSDKRVILPNDGLLL